MATGTAVFPHLLEIWQVFSNGHALARLGLITERLASTSFYRNMRHDHPDVMAEQEKMMHIGNLGVRMLCQRLRSCGEHLWAYHNRFYRLAVF